MNTTDFEMEGPQPQAKRRRSRKKDDDLLLPLLARVSTVEARALLAKHGKPDAIGYDDLEVKLANLYQTSPDKVEIEKEFAEIHPHKDWLLKRLPPIEQPKEEIKLPPAQGISSSADGAEIEMNSGNKHSPCQCEYCRLGNSYSGFNGAANGMNGNRSNMELIALVSIVGLTLYLIHKH